MGLIRKVASIMMLGGVSSHARREPPGKAERARTKAERAREEAAQAQAMLSDASSTRAGCGSGPSGGITLGTRPHGSALGPVAGLAPPSVRVE
jgi:hypothetical protein